MAKFCRYCGKPVKEGAKFCKTCGKPLARKNVQPVQQRPADKLPVLQNPADQAPTQQAAINKADNTSRPEITTPSETKKSVIPEMPKPKHPTGIMAGAAAGEFGVGAFYFNANPQGLAGKGVKKAREILSPAKTFISGFKGIGGKLKHLFAGKNVKYMIPSFVLIVLWIVLLILRREGVFNAGTTVLNFLTFGSGGASNNVLCIIGGSMGKGVVAAALTAFVSGGHKKLGSGIRNLFKGSNFKKEGIGQFLLGTGAALLLYQFFAWKANWMDLMSAISGASLSLMALGGMGGFIPSFVRSVTAGKTVAKEDPSKGGTKRFPQTNKKNAVFAGLAAGFALAVPLSFTGFSLMPLAAGVNFIIIGFIFALIFRNSTGSGDKVSSGGSNGNVQNKPGITVPVRQISVSLIAVAVVLLTMMPPTVVNADSKKGEYSFTVDYVNEVSDYGWYDLYYYEKNGVKSKNYTRAFYPEFFSLSPDAYEKKQAEVEIKKDTITIRIPPDDNELLLRKNLPDESPYLGGELYGYRNRSEIVLKGRIESEKKQTGSSYSRITGTLHVESEEFREECTYTCRLDDGYEYGEIHRFHPDDFSNSDGEFYIEYNTNGEAKIIISIYCTGQGTMEYFNSEPMSQMVCQMDFDSLAIGLMTDDFDYGGTTTEPKSQEKFDWAKIDPGEDDGGIIDNDIVVGKHPSLPAAILDGILILVSGFTGALSGKEEDEEEEEVIIEKPKIYKMCVNKTFGDTLRKGEEPRWVYARILEVIENGPERSREDLTEKIVAFSGDQSLDVRDAGMTSNGYRAAQVSVPEGSTNTEGLVSFCFKGEGGTYTRHIIFKLTEPMILFGQENLGLPAHYEKEACLEFEVFNMPENASVTARIDHKGNKEAYSVDLVQKEDDKTHYIAVIRDILKYDEEEPGTTKLYSLHVEAESAGASGKTEHIERDLPIFRIHMGLVLHMEADAIGCFLKLREGTREKAVVRSAGSDLAMGIDATAVSGLGALQSLTGTGIQAMMDASVSTDIRDEDKEPAVTNGTIMLLRWNDDNEEEQFIERVAVYPEKICKVTALRIEQNKNALAGPAGEADQRIVDTLKICCFATNDLDDVQGARIIRFCCTEAGLDQPTRYRAELEVKAKYRGKEYTAKKNVLLHSIPYRVFESFEDRANVLKYDEKITIQLNHIQNEIYHNYYRNLAALHNLIERMLNGYTKAFGYDRRQVERVISAYTRYLRRELAGARGDTYVQTISDEIDAVIAWVEGMRDNNGILGRVVLGVCTAGFSEVLFFGMELKDKMKEKVFACKGGDDEFGFWDGITLGVKEYEKQLAWGLAFGAALSVGNTVLSGAVSAAVGKEVNILASAASKWKNAMVNADMALKSKSVTYKGAASVLDAITGYTNQSARVLSNTINKNLSMDSAAKGKAELTIAQRRMGNQNWTAQELRDFETHKLSFKTGREKVLRLAEVTKAKGTARASGTWENAITAYDNAWAEVKFDKNAFKYLKNWKDPYAVTVRAEFTRVRKLNRAKYMEKVLDDIALSTGKDRNSLYVESATSGKAWKEDAGLSLGEDYDVTVREIVYSQSNDLLYNNGARDIVIDQSIGEKALARQVYKQFHGGAEPPSIEAAMEFAAKEADVTYVSPWMDQGNKYEIEFNPDAYPRLGQMTDPSKFGESIDALALTRNTIRHKGMEWINRGRQEDSLAAILENEASNLSGAAKSAKITAATGHRLKAHSFYVEGVRQVVKIADNIIGPRNIYHEAKGLGNKYTMEVREMVALGGKVQDGWDPKDFFRVLESDYKVDFEGFVMKVAECLV